MTKKNKTTQEIRATSLLIITAITAFGKRSCRKLAERIGRSKSSVHRLEQAREKRNQHPESSLWETEAGVAWLRLLVFAVLYTFGLDRQVGAEKLSTFFKLIRIDTHIGVSPSALLKQLNQMEKLLPLFQQQCESEAKLSSSHPAVVAADETFLGDNLILVLMELSSCYLILEDLSDDRQFDTWLAKAAPRLEALGLEVNHAISDRAKALIKLAMTGFECESGADLFHAQQDISRWLGAKLGRQQAQAAKQHDAAETALAKAPTDDNLQQLAASVDAEMACNVIKARCADYHSELSSVSDEVHPFSLCDNQPRTSESVISGLEKRARAFEKIAQSAKIADSKQTLQKFRNQFDGLAVHITFWWQWVFEILTVMAVNQETQNWLAHTLLPVVYWHQQWQKTKNPRQREKYRLAWERASATLQADELTATLSDGEMQRWLEWAQWMAGKFYRSSSAVEGRNGYLSQIHHNGRGLTEQRLRALTVIHNYGIKRLDGTTAAMRLFGRDFPDLFSWLVNQMGVLPLPRNGRKHAAPNPLVLLTVPS